MTARLWLLGISLWATASTASAAELRHRVGSGETLEIVAKNYYGASWKAVYIAARNNLADHAPVVGKRVVIPASWIYKVRRGDSVAAIAKRALGDADRHKAIIHFNNIKDPADLATGQALLMPFHLFHHVKPGETLSQISRRYYRTTRRTSILKDYNDIDTLKPGMRIVVPIFDSSTVDVKSRRYNPASQSAAQKAPPPDREAPLSREQAAERLKRAVAGYETGSFDDSCEELDYLLQANVLAGGEKIVLIKYLGFCAVAYDDSEAAADYFRKWIELEPKASLDQVTTSPKILEVFFEVASESQDAGLREPR